MEDPGVVGTKGYLARYTLGPTTSGIPIRGGARPPAPQRDRLSTVPSILSRLSHVPFVLSGLSHVPFVLSAV